MTYFDEKMQQFIYGAISDLVCNIIFLYIAFVVIICVSFMTLSKKQD